MARSERNRRIATVAAVAAVALALYARTIGFGFSYLDDDALIVDQQGALAAPGSVWRAFGRPYFPSGAGGARDHAYYRPIVTASLALDAHRGGAAPRAYRLTNVALHALAAALVVVLLRRLGHREGVALFGGLLFAVHPALTEAVAWIPGRNDQLLVVLALAAWLLLFRAREPGRWGSRVAHPVVWLAALGAKEAALVLPVVFAGHLLLVERRPVRDVARPWLLGGWAAALAVYLAARAAVLSDHLGAAGVAGATASAGGGLALVANSLGKLLVPVQPSVLATAEDTALAPGLVAVALAIAAIAWTRPRRTPLVFALVCFVAFVAASLPASRVLQLESRLALPAVAIVIAVAEVAGRLGGPARVRSAGGGLVVAALAAVSIAYTGDFSDRRAFSEASVHGSPRSALARRNLGVTLQLAGETEAARRAYEAALANDAAEPVVRNNLAVMAMADGRLPEAERLLREELAVNPSYEPARRNLALVLRAMGRPTSP
jgi:tetratricopeptide (TPR) repeat protein